MALKCSMTPGIEWEEDNVDCLQPPRSHDNQSRRGGLNEDASCFAHITFSLPDSATCVFKSWPEEMDGVREDKGLQWTEEAFPRPGPHGKLLLASPTATCSNPQSPSAYHGPLGGLTSRGGLEEKPSLQLTSISACPTYSTGV